MDSFTLVAREGDRSSRQIYDFTWENGTELNRPSNINNQLKILRAAKGLSQGDLATSAHITRQAVCAIEGNQYLPTTGVALRLAGALGCRVEDLFSLRETGEIITGELIGEHDRSGDIHTPVRVKVARVEDRYVIRPVTALGELLAYTVPADGLLMEDEGTVRSREKVSKRARVQLLRDRPVIEQEIAIAGCDPAIFLAGEPKGIRSVEDLSRKDITLINRAPGAGVRHLLDQRLEKEGLHNRDVRGYNLIAESHFQVARRVSEGLADVGVGVRSARNLFGLDFIPLQQSRYDLVVPKPYLSTHPGIGNFLEAIVSRQFRTEIEALGGYDTTETGKIRNYGRDEKSSCLNMSDQASDT